MLGSRLRNDVGLMMRHKGKSALEILGSLDDLKFRSCLTLFAQAALGNSEREVFNEDEPDPRTLELLDSR